MDLFNACIEVILRNEGGFQKDPDDPGNWVGGFRTGTLVGTKYGIAAKFFPELDIPNLSVSEAKLIYYESYWRLMTLEGINNPEIVLQIFDMGVNAGIETAIKRAQNIAVVKKDGDIGPITTRAINNYCGNFLKDYKHDRKIYYEWLVGRKTNLRKFLPGWLARIENTKLFN